MMNSQNKVLIQSHTGIRSAIRHRSLSNPCKSLCNARTLLVAILGVISVHSAAPPSAMLEIPAKNGMNLPNHLLMNLQLCEGENVQVAFKLYHQSWLPFYHASHLLIDTEGFRQQLQIQMDSEPSDMPVWVITTSDPAMQIAKLAVQHGLPLNGSTATSWEILKNYRGGPNHLLGEKISTAALLTPGELEAYRNKNVPEICNHRSIFKFAKEDYEKLHGIAPPVKLDRYRWNHSHWVLTPPGQGAPKRHFVNNPHHRYTNGEEQGVSDLRVLRGY